MRFTTTVWTRTNALQLKCEDVNDAHEFLDSWMALGATMGQIRLESTGSIFHRRFAAPILESRSTLEASERAWARKGGE